MTTSINLSEQYKKAVLYPSIAVFILTVIFSIIDNYNYKSEWLTAGSVIFLSIITDFIYCLILSLLSLTIFLNRFDKVKDNKVLNFLSWFLLPFLFMSIVLVHEVSFKFKYKEEFGSDFVYTIILNLPFMCGLIWTYLQYKKNNYRQHGIAKSAF